MISSREEVTKLIIAAKVTKGLKWRQVADAIGLSKE
jgi:cyanate lyase